MYNLLSYCPPILLEEKDPCALRVHNISTEQCLWSQHSEQCGQKILLLKERGIVFCPLFVEFYYSFECEDCVKNMYHQINVKGLLTVRKHVVFIECDKKNTVPGRI
jgi:hypothetical protein